MFTRRLLRTCALATAAFIGGIATPVLAQVGIDGAIGPEWSGPGVTTRAVTYDMGAPLGNFGTPGTTNHAVAYTTYFRADSTFVYAAVAANPGGGGSAAGVQFANLYFSSTFANGSIAIEVGNNRFFRGGVNTGGPNNDGYYPAGGYATQASSIPNGVIEVAIPIAFFQTDPLGMGFAPSTTQLRFNLSQSFGYSVAGGTAYNAPMGPDERLGLVTFAPPAYAVQLQSANDCRTDGMLSVDLVLTSAPALSAASGGQFFLSFDNGLSVMSITPGSGLIDVGDVFNNGAHTANVAVAVDFLSNPNAKLSAGQTLATILFAAPGTYCGAPGLVAFRGNNPPTRLTDSGGNAIGVGSAALGTLTLNDSTGPVITCPPNPLPLAWSAGKDPWATGYATATDNCDPSPVITYVDDRSGLIACGNIGGRGTILRTWKATDHCGNSNTCTQTITVVDNDGPIVTAPANIATNADAGGCTAVVNFMDGTAYDVQHRENFENAAWLAGGPTVGLPTDSPSTDWNRYNSVITRVPTGTDGVPSSGLGSTGDGRIDPANVPVAPDNSTGVFSRLGGYSSVFANGFTASQDIYINLSDSTVANSTYGFDVSVAANDQSGNHLRDFIFHAAGSPTQVLIAADNNSNNARRNDLGTLPNHVALTSSGWYHFEWNFRNNAGVLAVDMNLYDSVGSLLFTDTRSAPSDLIASVVGGNRYMWFTFVVADNLHIDNTSLIRPLPTISTPSSGSSFASGVNTVTVSATDACGNLGSDTFTVTVNSFNTLDTRVEESGLSGAAIRCVTFDMWNACPQTAPTASVSGNVAFNSTNSINFDSYADGALPGAGGSDTRTPGALGTWWLPSNCATSAQVSSVASRTLGGKGLIVGNNGNGNDGVINNLESPRLSFPSGETATPVNSASSKFISSYWFRTASATPADGFSFKSETWGPDRTTYFGAFYQTANGDTDLNCGAYAIEEVSPSNFDFAWHPIASNLTWGAWYRVEVGITFVNGANNDIVDYKLFNSANVQIGQALGLRTWEEGARQFGYAGGQIFGVDAVQFQARGDYSAGGAHDVAYVDDITYAALPSVLMDVPCGVSYTGVTARDEKHTLRRTGIAAPNFGTSGARYFARFDTATGKPLKQGNLNDDSYVDILDAGIFLGQFNAPLGGSTPCGYVGHHSDFSGDGLVFTEDFTFIQAAFLQFRENDPCGGALTGSGPVTDISVDDAMAQGLREVAMIDYTLDGRVNAADIAWIAAHGLPRCIADFNDDQRTDVSDIFSYLNAWFMGHPRADTNANTRVEVQDLFDFINVWFQGC